MTVESQQDAPLYQNVWDKALGGFRPMTEAEKRQLIKDRIRHEEEYN